MSNTFNPTHITWSALLGRWVEFARSAVGLPDDPDAQRMRESVPDIIMLQAVWFALQHLDELSPDERALGVDRAAILIDKHEGQLRQRWRGASMPQALSDIMDDARRQLQSAAVKPRDQHS